MIGSFATRKIPSSRARLSEVADLLSKQAQGSKPGDVFLLSTNLVESQPRIRSMHHCEDEDAIVSTHYLGVVDAGGADFFRVIGERVLTGKLHLDARSFVESGSQGILNHGPIVLDYLHMRCTPIDQPIPRYLQYLMGTQTTTEDWPDQYPFMIVVGQEKIEEYVSKYGGSMIEFYTIARRILNLPPPVRQETRDTDGEMVRRAVLSLYDMWQEMRRNNKEIDRIMSLPSKDDRFDKVAAIFMSSGHRDQNAMLAERIHHRVALLKKMGVHRENLRVGIDHTPGLMLDVSAFMDWFDRVFKKEG